MSKLLMYIGGIVFLIGLIVFIFENSGIKLLNWFGNLPGDIKIEKDNFKFYFPITSMIIVSIVLTLLLKVLRKFF